MALKVANFNCVGGQATVTLESDARDHGAAIGELQSQDAKRLALEEAARRGLGNVAINGFGEAPYPITGEGKPLDNPFQDVAAGYRIDIPVMSRPF